MQYLFCRKFCYESTSERILKIDLFLRSYRHEALTPAFSYTNPRRGSTTIPYNKIATMNMHFKLCIRRLAY